MPKTKRSNSSRHINSAYSYKPNKNSESSKKSWTEEFSSESLMDKVKVEFKSNQSYLNLILGLVIVLVVGVLVFNYFKKDQADLGPGGETVSEEAADVKPEELPGKYTVKEGDTLFTIAEKYYQDGYKFWQIAELNKLANVDTIEAGQVLEIPKLEVNAPEAPKEEGTGGAVNLTTWGETITGETYTVVEGDWLSTIAGRAYDGDIMAFDKIAQANNITNPDLIETGTVLKIPR